MGSRTITGSVARAVAHGPAAEAVASLTASLDHALAGRPASVVLYFASSRYDPADLAGPIAAHFGDAAVLGCSTAGEFTDQEASTGGIAAVAVPRDVVPRFAAALGDLDDGALDGTLTAVAAVEAALGSSLRSLDPSRHLGFVLIDGMHCGEEAVNEALGNAAPLLDIVGGSAGDDLAFVDTWVAVGDRVSHNGVALVVCETAVPFRVVKTCTFRPSGRRLRVTRADAANRIVYDFDGRDAREVYAEAVGHTVDELGSDVFMHAPVGLMVDGEPFIRSPQRLTPDGGIRFYCQVLEGMDVELMRSGDLIADTAAAFDELLADLGGHASGAVVFNCVLRRLEIDADGRTDAFLAALRGIPGAGFHTYGESWLGHINQTLTGVVFG